MIKLISIDANEGSAKRVTIYADTKAEVASTGAATSVTGLDGAIAPASILFTSAFEVAILKSDDDWEWDA